MRFLFSAILLTALATTAWAQTGDTLQTNRGLVGGEVVKPSKNQKYYDPKVATKRSAIIPGWGQIYNDSWWKVPILYGGFGVAAYYIDFNNDLYHEYLDLYNEEIAKDDPNEDFVRVYSRRADTWRKNRDLVILTTVGIYALQIIDASVDAHLKGFNVDENLALNIKPKVGVIGNGTPYIGMGITLPIGK